MHARPITHIEPRTIEVNAPEGRITARCVGRSVVSGARGNKRSYLVDVDGRAYWRSASGGWVTR